MALAAYRQLMRSARIAFNGDAHILSAAQLQIRQEFRDKSALDPSDASIPDAIHHAQDVARILRENVVQGTKSETKEDTYKLRIHDLTERGDNDTVKVAGGNCGCK